MARHRRSCTLLQTLESRLLFSAATLNDSIHHHSGSADYLAAIHATLLPSAPQQAGSTQSIKPADSTSSAVVTGITAQFYLGNNFQTPVLAQYVSSIVAKWGKAGPDPSLTKQTFTARYTGQITPTASGLTTIYLKATGGMRLYVNNQLVINAWSNKGSKELKAKVNLTAGQAASMRVEYLCNGGMNGAIQLSWAAGNTKKQVVPGAAYTTSTTPVLAASAGLSAQYFLGENFDTALFIRRDPAINFVWGRGTPSSQIPAGAPFSIRWLGQITPKFSETYTFSTESDDGIRLWINGQLLIDNWTVHPQTENQGTIALQAGQSYDIKVEFFQNSIPPATMQLFWESASQSLEIVPASAFTTTPAASAGTLTGEPVSASEVDLAWTGSSTAAGYIVDRSSDGGTTWATAGTTAAAVTTFADMAVSGGTRYLYRVRPTGPADTATPSNTITALTPPAVPGNIAATALSETALAISWTSVTGATQYLIERSTDGSTFSALTTVNAALHAYTDTGLSAGKHYWYRVLATNASGNSDHSAPATGTTGAPAAPNSLLVIPTSATQMALTWSPSPTASGYLVQRSADGSTNWTTLATTTLPAYQDNGLSAGGTYYYRVISTGDSLNSAPSPVASATTLPGAPALSSTTATSATSINLNWQDVPGETGFLIFQSTDRGSHYTQIASTAQSVLSYTINGLTPGTPYLYQIEAINNGGHSPASTTPSIMTPTLAPAGVTALAVSSGEIDIAWTAVTNATSYVLQRSIDGTIYTDFATAMSGTTSAQDNTVLPGGQYFYRVLAVNAAGRSSPSSPAFATSLAAGALGLAARALSASSVALTWNAASGATGYAVQVSTDGTTFTTLTTVGSSTLTYNATGLSAATLYTFRIVSTSNGGPTNGAPAIATTLTLAPATLSAVARGTGISLAWTPVAGATGYTVERSPDGSLNWSAVGTTASNVALLSDVSTLAGTTYFYRVEAQNAGGISVPSITASALTLPGTPISLSGTPFTTTITLAWQAVTGASSYTLQRSPDGTSNWTTIANGLTATTTQDTGLILGTTYHYRLIASNSSGDSPASSVMTATLVPAAPILTAAITGTTAALSWNTVSGATGYLVERSTDGTTWTTIGTPTATSLQDTTLALGATYTYRVIATNSGGNSAPATSTALITVPTTPAGLLASSISSSQINLLWTPITGETSVLIQRSTDGTTFTTIATVSSGTLAYADATVTASTTYTYRIIATNSAGNSDISNRATATAAPLSIYATLSTIYGVTADADVFAINPTSATSTWIGALSFATSAAGRDPADGKLYYVEQGTTAPRLAVWDPTTGANTTISTLNLTGTVTRTAFRADDALFLTAGNGDLYTVNVSTGVATRLGALTTMGMNLTDNTGDMAFSPTGTLYLSTNSLFYTVNTSTLVATPIGTMGLGPIQFTFGNGGTMVATNGSGNVYSLNLLTLIPTFLGLDNHSTNFTDLASVPLFADLSLSQTASLLHRGGTATYTIQAANLGPSATNGPTVITDTLPAGLTFISATGSGWTFTTANSTITMTYSAPLAAGTVFPPLMLTVSVAPAFLAPVTNVLSIATNLFDTNMLNNISSLTSVVL